MTPIAGCLFDLGNVMVGFCHERMWRQLAAATGVPAARLRAEFPAGGRFAAYDRGAVTDDEAFAALTEIAGRPLDRAAVFHALSDIFEPRPEMAALAADLRRRGLRLGLVSNTIGPHFEHLRRAYPEALAPFETFVLSYRVRAAKPDPAIYAAALAALELPAAATLFIDDLPANVAGARAVGMRAELFADAASLRGQLAALGLR